MPQKIKLCKEKSCKNQQTTLGYCRLHYLKNQKTIQQEQKLKSSKALSRYVDHMIHYAEKEKGAKKEMGGHPVALELAEEGFSKDEFDLIMEELEYKEDLDKLLAEMKVDRNF